MATCGKIDKYKREVCVVTVDGERKSGSNGGRHGLVVAAPPSPVATGPRIKGKTGGSGKSDEGKAKPGLGGSGQVKACKHSAAVVAVVSSR
jgi:hypothetical protein